jgi:heat shock protein HslJ
MLEFAMVPFRLAAGVLGLVALVAAGGMTDAEPGFPFDKELLLDTKPMKGSKRIPILTIGPRGEATIDLWCNSVAGQITVAANTVTITTGTKTERQCDQPRMKGDDDLLEALAQVTSWRRDGQVLILHGAKTLRFYSATN